MVFPRHSMTKGVLSRVSTFWFRQERTTSSVTSRADWCAGVVTWDTTGVIATHDLSRPVFSHRLSEHPVSPCPRRLGWAGLSLGAACSACCLVPLVLRLQGGRAQRAQSRLHVSWRARPCCRLLLFRALCLHPDTQRQPLRPTVLPTAIQAHA